MAIHDLGWRDHFLHASGLANMVTMAAHDVADPDTKAGLMAVAKAIDQHIETGIDMVAAELKSKCHLPGQPSAKHG